MELRQLSDQSLVEELKSLVAKERSVLLELLRHLREVERRKLFLARGCSSLFAFCTDVLGYSGPEAHVRIQAMRLTKAVPEVESHLEQGALTLTAAAQAQGCFRREEKADRPLSSEMKQEIVVELLNTSTREVEKKLAEHF